MYSVCILFHPKDPLGKALWAWASDFYYHGSLNRCVSLPILQEWALPGPGVVIIAEGQVLAIQANLPSKEHYVQWVEYVQRSLQREIFREPPRGESEGRSVILHPSSGQENG